MTPHFYTPDELQAADKATLETIAQARGLTVKGTGESGNVLKEDLTAAIEAEQDATGVNPALVAAPVERKPQTYDVVGPRRVHDTPSGGSFKAVLSEAQEASLIEAGHIQIRPPANTARKA